MIGTFKNYLLLRLTKKLLRVVLEEDILQVTNQGYLVNNRRLSPEEVAVLKEEARLLKDSFLWKMMLNEVEYLAFIKMSYRAARPEDIIHGNAMFLAVDTLRKFLKNISV